jgi:hypothetical protein
MQNQILCSIILWGSSFLVGTPKFNSKFVKSLFKLATIEEPIVIGGLCKSHHKSSHRSHVLYILLNCRRHLQPLDEHACMYNKKWKIYLLFFFMKLLMINNECANTLTLSFNSPMFSLVVTPLENHYVLMVLYMAFTLFLVLDSLYSWWICGVFLDIYFVCFSMD